MKNQNYFLKELTGINGVTLFNYKEGVVYGNLPVLFEEPMSKELFHGVECHKYYYPLQNKRQSMNLYDRIINFPLYDSIKKYQMDEIIKQIKLLQEKKE